MKNKQKNPYVFKINNRLGKIELSNNDRKTENPIMNVIKSIYK